MNFVTPEFSIPDVSRSSRHSATEPLTPSQSSHIAYEVDQYPENDANVSETESRKGHRPLLLLTFFFSKAGITLTEIRWALCLLFAKYFFKCASIGFLLYSYSYFLFRPSMKWFLVAWSIPAHIIGASWSHAREPTTDRSTAQTVLFNLITCILRRLLIHFPILRVIYLEFEPPWSMQTHFFLHGAWVVSQFIKSESEFFTNNK